MLYVYVNKTGRQVTLNLFTPPSLETLAPALPLWAGASAPILFELPPIDSEESMNSELILTEPYVAEIVDKLAAAQQAVMTRAKEHHNLLQKVSLDKDKEAHKIQLGQRAWLSVPLDNPGKLNDKNRSLMFRWVGPVRVIAITGKDSEAQYTIVEAFPGNQIVTRTVHVSRLRPYTERLPADSAEEAADLAGATYDKELEQWRTAKKRHRQPSSKTMMAPGIHPEFVRRYFEPEEDEADPADIEYQIERIKSHTFDGEKYIYLTKWLGYSSKHDWNQLEEDLHPKAIQDYWDHVKDNDPGEFKKREEFLATRPAKRARASTTKGKEPATAETLAKPTSIPKQPVTPIPLPATGTRRSARLQKTK
ncbi:hypothetical protein DFJ73DRAFT_761031 [Zopfochytrium polystomum]|nr:hypothetical protein DFJ73DRAFT_761031 [Zopfochytrium polystomum]